MATEYGTEFFDAIREGCRRSADVVVPLVLEHINAERVVDIGCGEGWFGKAFEDAGCTVFGFDGPDAEPVINHFVADLSLPDSLVLHGISADLAVCLEVAEHLPSKRAPGFVEELCQWPVVVFSAAIPGQGGHGHLNEQWPAYWVELFEQQGFSCSGALRWEMWRDDRVENWYRQNLIVAAKTPGDLPRLFNTPLSPVWPVVHPVLFDARR